MGDWRFAAVRIELLVAARPRHEFADSFLRALVAVKDGMHLFGDGHFDGVACGEPQCGGGAANPFRYFAVEPGNNVRQLAAPSEFNADGAVAGEGSRAGEDEVAYPGQAGKRLAATAAGYGETSHFSDAAGDEGGGGVVAKVEA